MTSNRGSEWLRWDVHIHTPGTALNNEYRAGAWDEYVQRINEATPPVVALGITDYLSIDSYIEMRRRWQQGELGNVSLLFPNVEFRLSVHTSKQRGINLHLLFCPDDTEHVDKIQVKL